MEPHNATDRGKVEFAPFPSHAIPEQGHMYDFTYIVKWMIESGINEHDLFKKDYNAWVKNEVRMTGIDTELKQLVNVCLKLYLK